MKVQDAIEIAQRILDQERFKPTVSYLPVGSGNPAFVNGVQADPQKFLFKSDNFELLCSLLDQVHEQDRPSLLAVALSRLSNRDSYRDRSNEISKLANPRAVPQSCLLSASYLLGAVKSNCSFTISVGQHRAPA